MSPLRFALLCAALSIPAPACVLTPGMLSAQRSAGSSQGWVYESWTVRDGLPVNGINALLQSHDGYIWAATWDGLVRFDGVRFTVFNTTTSPELPSSRLLRMFETRDSSLWLITEQAQLIRFRHGRFTHIGSAEGLTGVPRHVHSAPDGGVWVPTSAGLGRIADGRFVRIAPDLLPGEISGVVARRDGTVWAGSDARGVYRIRADRAERLLTGTPLDTALVTPLLEDGAGRLWLATSLGLWVDAGGLRPVLLGGRPVIDVGTVLYAERERTTYAFTAAGVLRIDPDLNVMRDVRHALRPWSVARVADDGALWYISEGRLYRDGTPVYDLSTRAVGEEITGFAADREGSVWVSTASSGLHRIKPALFTTLSVPEGLGNPNVYPVYEDRAGGIWVGMHFAGMSRIGADGGIRSYPPSRGYPIYVSSFHSDRADRLWLGTPRGLRECTLPAVTCSAESLPEGSVWALYGDSRGRVWAGMDNAVAVLEHGRWSELDSDVVRQTRVRAFTETRDGALWMGTNGAGVLRYENGTITRVTVEDGLPSLLVRALYEDADGWLWIGSEGRGLARLDPRAWAPGSRRARRIQRIGTEDGLFDDVIHQILEDDAGRMWMNTNRGIFWIPRSELIAFADGRIAAVHSTSYSERDGIRNREGNGGVQPAGVKARDGRLWFPTQDGVVHVDPAVITNNLTRPPVVIERVAAGDTSYVPGGVPLQLGVHQRDLQIEYTALSLLEPGNVQFRYRLEPYDAAWVEAGTRRNAFYTRVPPGRYTFRVIASNNEGVWNEAGAALQLSLAYQPWETAAFRLFALLALLSFTLLLFRWRSSRLRQRALALEEMVALRTQELRAREQQLAAQNEQLATQAVQLQELDRAKSNFFANVSHEFRTPLTLTIGPLEDAQSLLPAEQRAVRRPIDMALRNARRLLRLVNQILDVAKLEAAEMKLQPRPLDLAAFTRGMTSAFDRVAESRGILLTVETPAVLRGAFDADALEKILTNLLSNAVKFTPEGGHVAVELRVVEGDVLLSVRDTGPGIPPEHVPHVFDRFYQVDETNLRAQPGTGIGLSLVKDLVELHGGTIEVVSGGRSTGTTFSVRIPLQPSADADDVVEVTDVADLADPVEPGTLDAVVEADGPGDDLPALLLVDDSVDLRAYVRAHFAPRFRVIEASDGPTALLLAKRNVPDIIVSDVMMPGMDGNELSRQLRSSPETDFIPIVLLTAQAAPEHRIAGLVQGADDYIAKPFEMRELEARVDNLIQSRKRLRERFAPSAPVPLPAHSALLQPRDRAFVERVCAAVEAHLGDPSFGVTELANAVFHDRSHLYRRVSELLGETPSELLRRARLEYACRLLDEDAGTVAHVAYAAGFNSVSSFSRAFREAYRMSPTEFRARPRPA